MMESGSGNGEGEDPNRGNLNRMKKRLTLDLDAPKSARKQRMNELLSTPELDKLKLTTPEIERLIMQQSGLTVSVVTNPLASGAVATPSSFLNPKNVSEEEEMYVKPFEAALAQLHNNEGSSGVPGLRFTGFGITPGGELPPDLSDVTIVRTGQVKAEVPAGEERVVRNFAGIGVASNSRTQNARVDHAYVAFGLPPLPVHAHPAPTIQADHDIKPCIKEDPDMDIDTIDYSSSLSAGDASCSGFGSSDANSPEPSASASGRKGGRRRSRAQTVSGGSFEGGSDAGSGSVAPIDMQDQETKKLERKRLRNRIAASKCRARKLERISRLEERVKHLKAENSDLNSIVSRLKEAVYSLKQDIIEHSKNGCDISIPPELLEHNGNGA